MSSLKAQFKNAAGTVIVMCPPQFYGVKSENFANAKEAQFAAEYAADPQAFRAKAVEQWKELVKIYESLGATVIQIAPSPGLIDQIYTADPAFTLVKDGKLNILRSRFTNQSRQPEVDAMTEALKLIVQQPGNALSGLPVDVREALNPVEGTGDAYYDSARNVIFAGYTQNPDPDNPVSGRSSIDAHTEMEQLTGVRVISLEIKAPCFHIDTCLTPLPTGHMLVYKAGMTPEAYDTLVQEAFVKYGLDPSEYLIELDQKEAEDNFITNLVCLGDTLVIPQFGENGEEGVEPVNPALLDRLRSIGYTVIVHNVSQLIKAGGAMHCTSHAVMEAVEGGYFSRKNTAKSIPEIA